MISGNIDKFSSPVRHIKGKVELSCGSSTPTTISGNPIVITDAVPGTPIEVQGDASTIVCGKNVINPQIYAGDSSGTTLNGDVFTTEFTNSAIYVNLGYGSKQQKHPKGTYTVSLIPVSEGACVSLYVYAVSGRTQLAAINDLREGGSLSLTFTANEEFFIAIGGPSKAYRGTHSYKLQLEIGTTATAYEPYQTATTAFSDTTTIYNNTGETITATYQRALPAYRETFTHDGTLKAITVERLGESKFFGFGIGQKANIKIIDKERACAATTEHFARIYFDDVRPLPRFYVSEVHRDENTNEVSITLYDRLYDTANHTVSELSLGSYTIGEFTTAVATLLGLGINLPALPEFELLYEEGANFNGDESLRDALNDVAEATQTIYYINSNDELTFKRLDKDGAAAYTIDKNQYITLDTKTNRRLTAIVSATELGDNLEATTGISGTTCIIRDNAFWDLREDRATLVENALAAVENLTINQFDCSWRGNYLLEPGDKLGLIAKDGSQVHSYLLNDTITYDGSFSQKTEWEYADEDVEHTNPVSLGEALKQTIAKVDKANQEISLVVSTTSESLDSINGELEEINKQVSTTVSKDEVEILISETISNGVSNVKTTTNSYTFDDKGLNIAKSESNISTTITEDGMTIKKNDDDVLTANNEGVKAIDLHATTFLIIGNNSRFEDYNGSRTACFWIGG